MCKHWNINPAVFRRRIKAGWSLEDSLTKDNQNINTEELENLRKENQELKSILYDECLIEVNGKDRLCKNGLLQAFSNAVIKIDEHNKRIAHSHEEKLNQ